MTICVSEQEDRVVTRYMGSGIKGLKKGWDQGSQPRIRDQNPRDRDQRVFHGLKDQASRFCGIRDQNFHHFWDQGLKICVKIRDQRRKNIPHYDPEKSHLEECFTDQVI